MIDFVKGINVSNAPLLRNERWNFRVSRASEYPQSCIFWHCAYNHDPTPCRVISTNVDCGSIKLDSFTKLKTIQSHIGFNKEVENIL